MITNYPDVGRRIADTGAGARDKEAGEAGMMPEDRSCAKEEKTAYAAWMAETVEPYLKEHGEKGYLKMEDGMSIAYRRYFLPDAGKCVVISHGFCEFAEKYNEVAYRFLQAGYSVYVPEHRGHGYSGREVDDPELVHVQSYDCYAADLARFVETVVSPGAEHRIVFAHSMGGAIAILALERYPQLFEAAVLSAPMCAMQTGKYPRFLAKLLAEFCCLTGKGKCFATLAGQQGFSETPQFEGSSCLSKERYDYMFQKRLLDEHYRTYGGSYAWVRAGLRASRKLMRRENLAKIKVPVLLFAAGRDHMVDNDAIARFAEETERTKLFFMPDSRHEIFNADERTRAKYYDEIFRFIKEEEVKDYENENEQTRKILGTV